MHLSDGQLRTFFDRALGEVERTTTENHLAACDSCHRRANELRSRSERVAAHLGALGAIPSRISPQGALARFEHKYSRKELALMKRIFSPRYRPAWALTALIALVAISMTFAPVRAWAEGLLAQFRVQRITVLPVDPSRLTELGTNETLVKQISQLMSDSMTVTKEPMKPTVAADAVLASQLAGFAVRLPSSRGDAPSITVQGGTAFRFTVNRPRAQSLMNQMGYARLQLPASLDGALIKVNIPVGATAAYGTCPKLDSEDAAKTRGSAGRTMLNCIILAEIPSPTVDTPPDLDVQQLAIIGLQFVGMKEDDARAFAKTVDWTSTLVVPIPRNSASSKQVPVDGVTGYLIQRPLDDAPQYALIWVKNGIVYAIGGLGNDTTTALQMGNSLK